MDTNLAILLAAALGAAVIIVWVWKIWLDIRSQKDNQKVWSAKDVLDDFKAAIEVIEKVAPAADQLVKLDQLGPAKRREYVVNTVSKLLPDLDPDILEALVEAWVVFDKPTVPGNTPPVAPVAPAV